MKTKNVNIFYQKELKNKTFFFGKVGRIISKTFLPILSAHLNGSKNP